MATPDSAMRGTALRLNRQMAARSALSGGGLRRLGGALLVDRQPSSPQPQVAR
jgi:hypothetical protein